MCSRVIGAEPCPSLLLQKHMAELLSVDKDMAASFLNSVLNQLNWAFSEFIGMIQEVSQRGHELQYPCRCSHLRVLLDQSCQTGQK